MGHFPFEWQVQDLRPKDFIHFNKQFSKTVLKLIPFAEGPVVVIDSTGDFSEALQRAGTLSTRKMHCSSRISTSQVRCYCGSRLFRCPKGQDIYSEQFLHRCT